MAHRPEQQLRDDIHAFLADLLTREPLATQSEAYLQHCVENALLLKAVTPRYVMRIGINYHGSKVQHITLDGNGVVVGWNPAGDVFGSRANARMRMAGWSIFPRTVGEQLMTDTRIMGGPVAPGEFVRAEFKVRG